MFSRIFLFWMYFNFVFFGTLYYQAEELKEENKKNQSTFNQFMKGSPKAKEEYQKWKSKK